MALDPDRYWSRLQLGRVYLSLGRLPEAVETLGACIALRPDAPWAYSVRGLCLALAKRFKEAHADLKRVLAVERDFRPALLNRGRLHWLEGKHAEALADFEAVLSPPDEKRLWEAAFDQGQLLVQLNKIDEAVAAFDRVVGAMPGFFPVYEQRARARLLLGLDSQALEDLNVYLGLGNPLAPENSDALTRRGGFLRRMIVSLPPEVQQQKWPLALADLKRAVELGGRSALLFEDLGAVHESMGQFSEAPSAYEEGLKIAPDDVDLLVLRAHVFERHKQFDKARDDFSKAASLDDTHAEAHAGLGYASARLGSSVEARREAQSALLLGRTDYLLLHNVACIYAALSETEEGRADEDQTLAVSLLKRGIELWKSDPRGPDPMPFILGEEAFPPSMKARPDFQELAQLHAAK